MSWGEGKTSPGGKERGCEGEEGPLLREVVREEQLKEARNVKRPTSRSWKIVWERLKSYHQQREREGGVRGVVGGEGWTERGSERG